MERKNGISISRSSIYLFLQPIMIEKIAIISTDCVLFRLCIPKIYFNYCIVTNNSLKYDELFIENYIVSFH